MNTSRIEYLDSIAGLMIILMLGLHFGLIPAGAHSIASFFSFYMAWFFFKSGMMHNDNHRLTLKFFEKLVKRILVPFAIFTLFGLILEFHKCYTQGLSFGTIIHSCGAQVLTMGFAWCNAPLWFLLALFIARMVTPFLSTKIWWIWICLFLSIAVLHHHLTTERFNYIGNSSLAIVYYLAGWKLKSAHTNKLLVIICALTYLIIFLIFPVFLDIRSNSTSYGNYLLAVTSAIPGIIIMNYLFASYRLLSIRVLSFMGENAMSFLVMHWPIMLTLRNLWGGVFPEDILKYIVTLATMSCCLVVCIFFNNHKSYKWIIGG